MVAAMAEPKPPKPADVRLAEALKRNISRRKQAAHTPAPAAARPKGERS
jgi:hypothetical protein